MLVAIAIAAHCASKDEQDAKNIFVLLHLAHCSGDVAAEVRTIRTSQDQQ